MINSDDPIHRITRIKQLAKKLRNELEEYNDPRRYLGYNKKTRKLTLKKSKKW